MRDLAIDLFSGIGGVTTGLMGTGNFDVVSVERSPKDPVLSDAYEKIHDLNYPDQKFVNSTISDWIDNDYLGIDRQVRLVHGSPPCQSYRAGKGETMDDVELGIAIASVVAHQDPEFFTLEQVPVYLKSEAFNYIMPVLTDYNVTVHKINLTRFGIPQDRDRIFLTACKTKFLDLQPESIHAGWGSTFDLNDPDALLMPTQSNNRRKRGINEPFPTIMRSHFIEDKRSGGYAIRKQFYKYMSRGILYPVPFEALVEACGFPREFKFHPDKPYNLANGAGIGNAFAPKFYRDFLKHTLENF